MSGALEIAAVGMQAQQRSLDTIANNISNINTPTFKRSELRFSELVGGNAATGSDLVPAQGTAGVEWRAWPLVDRQGQLEPTGNPRDLAIDGLGFIELLGTDGRTLLWRGGSLRVLEDGTLATAGGYPLKSGINVPAEASGFRIDRDGKVYASLPSALSDSQGGESEIGRINLVKTADFAQLERLEGGVFALDEDGTVTEAGPGEEGLGSLVQASLERSNVDLNTEMVSLLISQRAYAANAQVVRAADELYGIANGLRR